MNKGLNFTVRWRPHSQPFSVGKGPDVNSYTLNSMSKMLNDIGDGKDALIVICLFLHVIPYHHDVFRTKMIRIKHSIDTLLQRNPEAKVFIKGPNTYVEYPSSHVRYNNWYAYVYSNILFKVFEGLHHKVIYLNNMDATDALLIKNLHPPHNVVKDMVDQMLSYAC